MDQGNIQRYLGFLKKSIAPALGCTEPAAIALAAAYAAQQLEGRVCSLTVCVSKYIFKNALHVGIPGTGLSGLDVAASLGALCAQPDKQLMVLQNLSKELKEQANRMVEEKAVEIRLADSSEKVWIQVDAQDDANCVQAVLSGSHTNLVRLTKNGRVLVSVPPPESDVQSAAHPYIVNFDEITAFAATVDIGELQFLRQAVALNMAIAREGLTQNYGLQVGKSVQAGDALGLTVADAANTAVAYTAAAADARMAGCELPVMSTAGSGNQGLTATLPVAVIGEKLGKPEELVLRSLAVSILVTIHAKQHIGKLSVLCGCSIAAAIGSCCGIVFLMGGSAADMKAGVNSMAADISGVVCDGAKPGCALKIATAVSAAIRAATMALNGTGAGKNNGIVAADVEDTLYNIGLLGNDGMQGTNEIILDIMLRKR